MWDCELYVRFHGHTPVSVRVCTQLLFLILPFVPLVTQLCSQTLPMYLEWYSMYVVMFVHTQCMYVCVCAYVHMSCHGIVAMSVVNGYGYTYIGPEFPKTKSPNTVFPEPQSKWRYSLLRVNSTLSILTCLLITC